MSVLAGAVAKLAALSIPAKAGAAGIAVALGVTGGVAAHAVEAAPTPPEVGVTVPADDATDGTTDAVDDSTDGTADGTTDGTDDATQDGTDDAPDAPDADAGHPATLPEAAQFGQSVAADARDGGVDGQEIADRAHERNADRAEAPEVETPEVETPEVETPDADAAPAAPAAEQARAGHARP